MRGFNVRWYLCSFFLPSLLFDSLPHFMLLSINIIFLLASTTQSRKEEEKKEWSERIRRGNRMLKLLFLSFFISPSPSFSSERTCFDERGDEEEKRERECYTDRDCQGIPGTSTTTTSLQTQIQRMNASSSWNHETRTEYFKEERKRERHEETHDSRKKSRRKQWVSHNKTVNRSKESKERTRRLQSHTVILYERHHFHHQ